MNNIERLNKEYNIDYFEDFIMSDEKHFTFYFDFQESNQVFYITSYKQSIFRDIKGSSFTFNDIIPYIVEDNELAEVEGKMTFIEDILKRMSQLEDETYLFIPIKIDDVVYWLTVGFYVQSYQNGKPKIVFGRVNRIQDTIPNEVHYYQLAHQDPATKLFTRETLRKHISMKNYYKGSWGLYIDIDGFKAINDRHGHKIGDIFLAKLAGRFISKWERDVIYYRLGGDEFFVMVDNHSKNDVIKRANELVETIKDIELEGYPFDVSASIGIVEINEKCKAYEDILDASDKAMYIAKADKTKIYHFTSLS